MTIGAQLKRAGMEMRFLLDGVEVGASPDAVLSAFLMRAHSLAQPVRDESGRPLWKKPARQKSMGAPYAAR